tara:strand:- start:2531 stop:3505 length:975 start_codon:yes stop_codon:yes gene_type:complete
MNPQCSAAIINFSYQTQAVRDLAWACFAPSMLQIEHVAGATPATAAARVSACPLLLTDERLQWLQALDHNPSSLLAHLSRRPTHRLGVYFEQLWHFFLQQDPQIELIAHNLAVHDGGRTLGEFDCIYYSRERGCHVHLELAVKYFLGIPRGGDTSSPANTHEWLGPDQRDRLGTKLDQLLQRQILLGDTAAAKRQLAAIGIEDMAREIALKGYLFKPIDDAPPLPPGYNSASTLGHWMPCSQLESHLTTLSAAAFAILPKMCWLSPALVAPSDSRLSAQELQDCLPLRWESDHYPLLIAALDERGTEASRFFVTPGSWPDPPQG